MKHQESLPIPLLQAVVLLSFTLFLAAQAQTPTILLQPKPQTTFVGGQVSFIVVADGQEPLNYEWRHERLAIAGATNSFFTLTNVQLSVAGAYSVTVSNDLGGVLSSNAMLTVLPVLPVSEALDATHLVWTTYGDAPWIGQTLESYDGMDAARSGSVLIGHPPEQPISWLEVSVVGPGTLSFRCKVSTCGGLYFYVNNTSPSAGFSGNTDWQRQTFNLSAGTNTLRWRYHNWPCPPVFPPDPPLEVENCAWLDAVSFVPAGLPPFSLSHGDLLPNGDYQLQLTGEPGREYTIQASTNLMHWVTLTTLTSPEGLAWFIDADAKLYPRRFYRAAAAVYTGPDLPVLIGIRQGGSMVLSWPASFAGFGLESTPTMSNAAWSLVVPAPTIVNGDYTVTNSITTGSEFYRLTKQ